MRRRGRSPAEGRQKICDLRVMPLTRRSLRKPRFESRSRTALVTCPLVPPQLLQCSSVLELRCVRILVCPLTVPRFCDPSVIRRGNRIGHRNRPRITALSDVGPRASIRRRAAQLRGRAWCGHGRHQPVPTECGCYLVARARDSATRLIAPSRASQRAATLAIARTATSRCSGRTE